MGLEELKRQQDEAPSKRKREIIAGPAAIKLLRIAVMRTGYQSRREEVLEVSVKSGTLAAFLN